MKKRSNLPLVVPDFFGTDEDVQRWIDVAYDVRVTRSRAFPGWVRTEYARLFGEDAPAGMEWELIKARIITYLENKRKGVLHGEALRNYKWAWGKEATRNKTYGFGARLRGTFLFEHKKTEDEKMASAKEIVDIIEKKPAKKKVVAKKKVAPKKPAKKKVVAKKPERKAARMSLFAAAIEVLRDIGKPMKCDDIFCEIEKRKLWGVPRGGKTPLASLNARLCVEANKNDGKVKRVGRGTYAIA